MRKLQFIPPAPEPRWHGPWLPPAEVVDIASIDEWPLFQEAVGPRRVFYFTGGPSLVAQKIVASPNDDGGWRILRYVQLNRLSVPKLVQDIEPGADLATAARAILKAIWLEPKETPK